jgi:hypothetical protein
MNWVEIMIASVLPLTLLVVLANRIITKKAIGVRIIQFTAVAMTVSGVLLLSLRHLIQGEAVAAIFGGLVGYLFANIAKFDERDRGSD